MVDSYHVRIRRVWTRINLYLHIALQVKAMVFGNFQFSFKFKPITCCTEIFLILFWVVLGLVSVLRMNKFEHLWGQFSKSF